MRRLVIGVGVLGAVGIGSVVMWSHDRRVGTRFVNDSINPFLVRRGLAGAGQSEIGTLEHLGRRSGTRRLTPVHPVLSGDEVRIVVPLGIQSEWARNVLAAGHCRIQLHDDVLELDQPRLESPRTIEDLPGASRWAFERLGFMYLRLHMAARQGGCLRAEGSAVAYAARVAGDLNPR
jgi:deazaflavin-dependent oxidoreductase (nitroreductase family)